MAKDTNKSIVIGRLTRAPELKSTGKGTYYCRFSLASNYQVKDGDGYKDQASFIDCVVWGRSAEAFHKYVSKGHRVCIEGSLRSSSWEDKDGKKHSKLEVHVEEFQFLQPKGEGRDETPREVENDSIPF